MLTAILVSFGAIFVAELGDKSQLMALTFATRFPAVPVLIGITVATALVHAVSVLVGGVLRRRADPRRSRSPPGCVRRLRVWTLRGDRPRPEDDERRGRAADAQRRADRQLAFFLAELGDKTMLATITLATRDGLFGTWLGSTLGMVAADALAIGVGRLLGTRLPERTIRIGAAVSFFVFAALLLVEAAGEAARQAGSRRTIGPCRDRA